MSGSGGPRAAVEALAVAVRAAPWHVTGYGALTLLSGAFPVVVAWCTKGLLDQITQPEPNATTAMRLVAVLVLVGVAAAAAPGLTLYLSTQQRRATALIAEDRLHRKINEFAGLARFENPAFLDRLRTARLSGPRAPGQLVDGVVGVTRAAVTVGGFALSVWIISPVFTLVVVASAVPVLVAELALALRRAHTQHGIGAFQRRESFYGSLLSTVKAAKLMHVPQAEPGRRYSRAFGAIVGHQGVRGTLRMMLVGSVTKPADQLLPGGDGEREDVAARVLRVPHQGVVGE
jgi:ATP-binding cassette, subfamily B, bacterial